VPPTAGFFGKFFLLLAGAGKGNYWLIAIAALNMVISFYYYLRIIKVMFMDENESPVERIRMPLMPKLALYACVAGIVMIGFMGFIFDYIHKLSPGM
jgi:NADH-quinone oxidoreductase subunit N